MARKMSEMTGSERDKLQSIIDRSIDFEGETFMGGGSWEGGYENIEFSQIAEGLEYLKSIGVKLNNQ